MKGLNKVKKTVALLATMALSISTLATYSYYGNVVMTANAEDTATKAEALCTAFSEGLDCLHSCYDSCLSGLYHAAADQHF